MNIRNNNPSPWGVTAFRVLFAAHAISLLGTGLTSVALGLMAYELVGGAASSVLGWTLAIRIAVIVLASPWAGMLAARLGARRAMIGCDFFRMLVVLGFLAVSEVWQIYVLAVFLNLGSALFTPVYKAVVPGVVGPAAYPKALAWGVTAYDAANILGPAMAALLIAGFGFQASFLGNALAFAVSGFLLLGLPRLAASGLEPGHQGGPAWSGMRAMVSRWPLRVSLLLALQVTVAGSFLLVTSIRLVKTEWDAGDVVYALLMAVNGLGSVAGALCYGRWVGARAVMRSAAGPLILAGLLVAAWLPHPGVVHVAWLAIGAGLAVLGIRGNELLADHSAPEERSGIYAAHFALSHAGWGLAYPLAGFLGAHLGFSGAGVFFAGLFVVVSAPVWLYWLWMQWLHRNMSDADHARCGSNGYSISHPHDHGDMSHRHWHVHL